MTVFGATAFKEVKLSKVIRVGPCLSKATRTREAHTQRRGQERTQGEDSHCQAERRGLRGNQPATTLNMDVQPPDWKK